MPILAKMYNNLLQNIDCVRSVSYRGSPFMEDIGEVKVKYKVTNDPVEWQYVERVLPSLLIPDPVKKSHYPSGWKPQGQNLSKRPYFIERTKNHMIPVYLKLGQRGIRRHTIIKKIHGDIFLLEKELKAFLQQDTIKPIRSQVNEFAGYIRMNGDFVNACKYWLEKHNY